MCHSPDESETSSTAHSPHEYNESACDSDETNDAEVAAILAGLFSAPPGPPHQETQQTIPLEPAAEWWDSDSDDDESNHPDPPPPAFSNPTPSPLRPARRRGRKLVHDVPSSPYSDMEYRIDEEDDDPPRTSTSGGGSTRRRIGSGNYTRKQATAPKTTHSTATTARLAQLAEMVCNRFPPLLDDSKPKRRISLRKSWIANTKTELAAVGDENDGIERVFVCVCCRKVYTSSNGLKYHFSVHEEADFPRGWYWKSGRVGPGEEGTSDEEEVTAAAAVVVDKKKKKGGEVGVKGKRKTVTTSVPAFVTAEFPALAEDAIPQRIAVKKCRFPNPEDPAVSLFYCIICGKEYASSNGLSSHFGSHAAEEFPRGWFWRAGEKRGPRKSLKGGEETAGSKKARCVGVPEFVRERFPPSTGSGTGQAWEPRRITLGNSQFTRPGEDKMYYCAACGKSYVTSHGLDYHYSHHAATDFPLGWFWKGIIEDDQVSDGGGKVEEREDDGDSRDSATSSPFPEGPKTASSATRALLLQRFPPPPLASSSSTNAVPPKPKRITLLQSSIPHPVNPSLKLFYCIVCMKELGTSNGLKYHYTAKHNASEFPPGWIWATGKVPLEEHEHGGENDALDDDEFSTDLPTPTDPFPTTDPDPTPLDATRKRKRISLSKSAFPNPLDPSITIYRCIVCEKEYTSSNGLRYHYSSHLPGDFPEGCYWKRGRVNPGEDESEEESEEEVDGEHGLDCREDVGVAAVVGRKKKLFACKEEGCEIVYSSHGGLRYHMVHHHGVGVKPVAQDHDMFFDADAWNNQVFKREKSESDKSEVKVDELEEGERGVVGGRAVAPVLQGVGVKAAVHGDGDVRNDQVFERVESENAKIEIKVGRSEDISLNDDE
ncbi:hypothetical protein HDU98_009426 [Podochytrium sp. JEL0797]|nr:hypothetical protein HDU98_009426 [Podochytrium sp. JEL0797]